MARILQFVLSFALVLVGMSSYAQSMKMVVDKHGEAVGRYVKTNKTTYTIGVQDDVEVPIKGHRVVTFSAKDGQGIIYRDQTRTGNINVRKGHQLMPLLLPKLPTLPRWDMFLIAMTALVR